jgi:hypothetical protein
MRRQLPFVLLAAIAVLALAWCLLDELELSPRDASNTRAPNAVVPANVTAAPPADDGANESRRQEGAPAPASDSNTTTKGLQLRVRLRGLHAKAPWTAPLRLSLDGRDEPRDQWLSFRDQRAPGADGLATFAVPDWCADAARQKGRLEARDPNYQMLQQRWDGAPDLAHELVVDVQVVGALTGRVLDHAGQPVAPARVVAFALRDGQPADTALATVNTREDGSYRLPAPPETPLWLVAVPMERPVGRMLETEDGGVPDSGALRVDLLPAATTATARIGEPTTVLDFVLAPASRITGSVKWVDGEAIVGAMLLAAANGAKRLPLQIVSGVTNGAFVERDASGRLFAGTAAVTDEHGEFELPGIAGATFEVRLLSLARTSAPTYFRPRPVQQAIAPQRVEFRLPRPVVLRALDGDTPVAQATLEIAGEPASGAITECRFVLATTLRVRASRERLRSRWRDIGPADAGTTIDLPLQAALTEVSIEFDGDFRVRNTVVHWRRDDGVEGREHLMRDDRPGAFQVFLEPGLYHVSAGPGGGERNGVFLLPSERDVEVGAETVSLRLPALFGGTFTVMATDSGGLYVAGTCQLHDRAGADHTASFRLENGGNNGRNGELLGGGTNTFTRVLPPGDYELMCDFGAHGAHREIVTIKPRETTDVRIRLP